MKRIFMTLVVIFLGVALFGATYTVRQGDTLEGIAAAQKVAVEQLAAINSIDPPYIIWVGQILEISQTSQNNQAITKSGDDNSLLLPKKFDNDLSSSSMSRRAFVWSKEPSAGGGVGRFWDDSANGYYRYADGKWQPIVLSSKISFGAWGEIGDDFCQVVKGDWSQSTLSFKVGPALDFYTPDCWFNSWSLKIYYGFCHADSRNGSWSKTQEDETWSANLWINAYQGVEPWFGKTSASVEYTGLIATDAVGGRNGQYSSISAYSPVKWESSLEQSLYKWGIGSVSLNLGYRHLDGEADPGKDRIFFGANIQLGWAKFVYELENGEKQQQKLEAQVSF